MQQHIDFLIAISVIGIFDENPAFQNWFSKWAKHTCDKSLTFLVVACPDNHLVQLDLVGIVFMRAWLCEISVQICNLKSWTPFTFKWHFMSVLMTILLLYITQSFIIQNDTL